MSDLKYFDDVGEHSHTLIRAMNATSSSGSHMHIWAVNEEVMIGPDTKLPAMSLILSGYDGAHDHTLAEGGMRTNVDGTHRHGVRIRGMQLGTEKDGAHDHELVVSRVGSVGPHQHALVFGNTTLLSLMPSDILALLAAEMADELEDESEPETDYELRQATVPGEALKSILEKTGRQVFGVEATGLPGRMLSSLDKLVLESDGAPRARP